MAHNGYLWWYLDVLDPVGGFGLTIIGFVGHVFSPAYARARAEAARYGFGPDGRQGVDPERHCALNVALSGPGLSRWVMSEWGPGAVAGGAVARDAAHLRLGATTMAWEGDELVVRLDARTAPFPAPLASPLGRAVRGEVRLRPLAPPAAEPVQLDAEGVHRWFPIAPVATASVRLSAPALSFEGHAYHDANQGEGPLERDFARWDWSRCTRSAPGNDAQPLETTVIYDTEPNQGRPRRWGRRFAADGQWVPVTPDQEVDLPETGWHVPRRVRLADGARVAASRPLLSAPFYNRSWLQVRAADGTPADAMHECFLGSRFAARWVRFLLPFKMRMERPERPAALLTGPERRP